MLVSYHELTLPSDSRPIVKLLESLHDFYCSGDNLEEDLRELDLVLKQESKRLAEMSKFLKGRIKADGENSSFRQWKLYRLQRNLSGIYVLRQLLNGVRWFSLNQMSYRELSKWCNSFVHDWANVFETPEKQRQANFVELVEARFNPPPVPVDDTPYEFYMDWVKETVKEMNDAVTVARRTRRKL